MPIGSHGSSWSGHVLERLDKIIKSGSGLVIRCGSCSAVLAAILITSDGRSISGFWQGGVVQQKRKKLPADPENSYRCTKSGTCQNKDQVRKIRLRFGKLIAPSGRRWSLRVIGNAFTSQIFLQYSDMARSDENLPIRLVLRIAILLHPCLS